MERRRIVWTIFGISRPVELVISRSNTREVIQIEVVAFAVDSRNDDGEGCCCANDNYYCGDRYSL